MTQSPEDLMHVPHPRSPSRVVAVRWVAWLLVAVALWDGGGLTFGGPNVTRSASYAALELIPGGMRTWGVILLAGAIAVSWGIGRDGRGHVHALNTVLAIGVGYYVLWTVAIAGTWVWLGFVPAWTALSKPALLAVLYYLCGRGAAPHRDDR